MISLSLNKTGLGARIGYYFISLFGKTLGIAYALTLAETTLAPVTPSNTARGGDHSPDHEVDRRQLRFQTRAQYLR